MIRHLPNTITLLNLLSGFFAMLLALTGHPLLAGWLVVLASVFDFLDGFAARLLNAYSELGRQLDSLADLVSFGVAPAAILYHLLSRLEGGATLTSPGSVFTLLLLITPALLVAAAALRLGRFNLDPSQESSFRGLPTPAAGLFFATLPHLLLIVPTGPADTTLALLLGAAAVLFSLLMVSRIPLFSLKFKERTLTALLPPVLLVLTAVPLLLFFALGAVPVIIILYIFMALFADLLAGNNPKD